MPSPVYWSRKATAYDSKGRFETITGTGLPAGGVVYGRVKDGQGTVVSELIDKHEFRDAQSTPLASATRSHEASRDPVTRRPAKGRMPAACTRCVPRRVKGDLITAVENKAGSPSAIVSKYEYLHDDPGRRASVVYSGSAFTSNHHFRWGYHDRSELTLDTPQRAKPAHCLVSPRAPVGRGQPLTRRV
jgi:hypothetical protein